jgi:hypothetical protein
MTSVAVFVVLPRTALIVTFVGALTPVVLIAKVAVVLPAATLTDAGTVAAALPLVSDTAVPPVPAGPLKVTVPVDPVPPVKVVGLKVTEDKAAGVTVRVAVLAPLPLPAVIVAVV